MRGIVQSCLLGAPVRFVLAGVIGFVADAGVLHLLITWFGVSAILGRVASFLCSSFVTWRINRSFTFRAGGNAGWFAEWLRYLGASAVGAGINYSLFALLVTTVPLAARVPTLGVAAGSVAGMVVNFALYKRMVFRGHGAPDC